MLLKTLHLPHADGRRPDAAARARCLHAGERMRCWMKPIFFYLMSRLSPRMMSSETLHAPSLHFVELLLITTHIYGTDTGVSAHRLNSAEGHTR